MAIVYVSPGLATGNNDGTTGANAFRSWADFATAGCAAGSDVRVNAGEASTSAVTLTNNINGSVAAGFTTITGYSTDWTTPTLRQRDGNGAGANIDGFLLTGVQFVKFSYIGATRYTRDGVRSVTTLSKWLLFFNCKFNSNSGVGANAAIAPFMSADYYQCVFNNNTSHGLSLGYQNKIICCEAYSNSTGFNMAGAAQMGVALYCIARNNTVGVAIASIGHHIVSCVIDANTTGITTSTIANISTMVGNRITNNATVGVAWGTAIVLEIGFWNHFYNNGANHTGANGLYVQNTDDLTAADPYTAQASQNFKNVNTAALYNNLVNVGIGNTNVTNVQAGLIRAMDYPAAANVWSGDTTDGDVGTEDQPALNKVAPSDTLRGDAGTMDLPVVGNLRDTDTLEGVTGTLLSNKILKSNATGSGAGSWDDDNLGVGSEANVSLGTAYGLSQTGTLSAGGVPTAPTIKEIKNVTESSAIVVLNLSPNAASYKVYRDGTLVASGVTDIEYTLTGLSPNTSYSITAKGTNGSGDSSASAASTFQTRASSGTAAITSRSSTTVAVVTVSGAPKIVGSGTVKVFDPRIIGNAISEAAADYYWKDVNENNGHSVLPMDP